MPPTNDFVPFCNENTGTNLPTQSAYIANPNLPIGNQPGIASSSFNNKALRQASTMAAILAQICANVQAVDMLDNQNTADHANPTALLKALDACLRRLPPVVTTYLSGSGNHQLTYKIFIATPSVSPTAGATYSDGTTTYTVSVTYDGISLNVKGSTALVATSGTLTKSAGTGDATLNFYAYRVASYMRLRAVGGGGGGSGSAAGGPNNGGSGGNGGDTTFGACTAGGGGGAQGPSTLAGGAPGTATLGGGFAGLAVNGGNGIGNSITATSLAGAAGAASALGGAGAGKNPVAVGSAATANTGAGGAGGGGSVTATVSGGGGGSGAFIDALLNSPSGQYAYSVGAVGTAGGAGTSGAAGTAGGTGMIEVTEHFQ